MNSRYSLMGDYARYPFALVLSQTMTEATLGKRPQSLGLQVHRPLKVVSMKSSATLRDAIDVSFESGESICAKYVVGADGSRSTVRNLMGIRFSDPVSTKTEKEVTSLTYIALADVTLKGSPDVGGIVGGCRGRGNILGVVPYRSRPAATDTKHTRPLYRILVFPQMIHFRTHIRHENICKQWWTRYDPFSTALPTLRSMISCGLLGSAIVLLLLTNIM